MNAIARETNGEGEGTATAAPAEAAANAVEAANAAAAETVREKEAVTESAIKGAEEATERASALVEAYEAKSAQIRAEIVRQDAEMEDLRASGKAAKAKLERNQADVARREAALESHERRTLETRIAKKRSIVAACEGILSTVSDALKAFEKRCLQKQAVREHQIVVCRKRIAGIEAASRNSPHGRDVRGLYAERAEMVNELNALEELNIEETAHEGARLDTLHARMVDLRSKLDHAKASLKASETELAQIEAGVKAKGDAAEAERLRAEVTEGQRTKAAEAAEREAMREGLRRPPAPAEAPPPQPEAPPPQPEAPRPSAWRTVVPAPSHIDKDSMRKAMQGLAPPRPDKNEGKRDGLANAMKARFETGDAGKIQRYT